MTRSEAIRLRRSIGIGCIVLLLCVDAFATGLFGGSERALAMARSVVLPGLPFLEWHAGIGLFTIAAALAAVAAWLRWGMDWLPVLVMAGSVAVAAWVMPLHHGEPASFHDNGKHAAPHDHHHSSQVPHASLAPLPTIQASHEFTVVLVVFALLARLRLLVTRIPAVSRLIVRYLPAMGIRHRDLWLSAALGVFTGKRPGSPDLVRDAQLMARTRRIDFWSRFRASAVPPDQGHAGIRAALALCGTLDARHYSKLRDESAASLAGVPASEPTWIRPLDGMLVALAFHNRGDNSLVDRWRETLSTSFRLRHGRRPAALHAPSMLAIGTLPDWEHALMADMAHELGWITNEDWNHLRPRCLGRAASNATDAESLRLIAAGLRWARREQDQEALDILSRRTLTADPLAVAISAIPGFSGRAVA